MNVVLVALVTDEIVLSASQLNNAIDCWRKWGFISLEKRPTQQHDSAALGSDTHKQLETYLNGGQLDYSRPSGYIAASGLHHLPAPKTVGMQLESKFKFQAPSLVWYTGYRDVFIPAEHREVGRPLVIDHKTTSGLGWAKTEEDLKTDPQALIYSMSAPADAVDLRWVYYQTRGARKSLPVETTLKREHVVKEFEKLEHLTAKPMVAIVDLYRRGRLHVLQDLPASPEACEKFGGCPFRPVCNLGPAERLRAVMNREKRSIMGLIDELRAGGPANSKSPVTPVADLVNPPHDTPAPTAETLPPAVAPAATELKGSAKSAATRKAMKAAEEAAKLVAAAPDQPVTDEPAVDLGALENGGFDVPAVPSSLQTDDGYTLYIDCAPNTPYVDAVHLFDLAKVAVCQKIAKADYRLADYGAGPGFLAVAIEDILKEAFRDSNLVVSTQCQETHACLAVLIKYAARVVRATR